MLAGAGPAEADDLDRFFLFENNVLAAIAGDVKPLRAEHQRRRLRTAGGEDQEEEDYFHPRRMGPEWLSLG